MLMEKLTVKQTVIQTKQIIKKENPTKYRLHRVKEGRKISLLNKRSKRATPHLP